MKKEEKDKLLADLKQAKEKLAKAAVRTEEIKNRPKPSS
jgi:hypothetical protein